MSEIENQFREKIKKKAIRMQIGGFRPPENVYSSWFGKVNFCSAAESWPKSDGKPMHALCQLNLTELPYRPHGLDDIQFITVFIGPDSLPEDSPNGENWCLRAYKNIDHLVKLQPEKTGSSIKSLPMRPEAIDEDYPCWEDLSVECPEELEDDYYDIFRNKSGFKIGGWPSLIQSEIFWAPWNKHPIKPEYVFQIDSTEKGNWIWGDGGVGYFGRGTETGKSDTWAISWQCY
jgi:uncharacterized protein YwqG